MRSGKDKDKDNYGSATEAWGYARVSTEQQKEQGISLVDQKAKIEGWGMYKGIKILDVLSDEGISGTKMKNRKNFMKLMDLLKKGQILVTFSLSRLSRSTKDALQLYDDLEKKGVHLVCLKEDFDTSTAGGRLFFRIMAAVNEFESEIASERTKESMSRLAPLGRSVGRPCYGWEKAGKEKGQGLIPVKSEQEVIKLILKKREENKSDSQIAKELNDEKIKPPVSSKQWYHSTVHNIIARGFNVNVKGRPMYENINIDGEEDGNEEKEDD